MTISLLAPAAILLSSFMATTPGMDNERPAGRSDMNLDSESQMPATALPGKWLSSFDDARKLATEQQVLLIVHFEASWCGPCRQMEANVLNRPPVLQQLTRYFVGVRIDADRNSDLISKFGIASLPTEIILNTDGKEVARFTGIASLDSYVNRLHSAASDSLVARQDGEQPSTSNANETDDGSDKTVRSCLLVQRDGKTVGLGGYCPVALVTQKVWKKGSEEFVAAFEGVEYFFGSDVLRKQFLSSPQDFVPRLHGCDPVELFQQNRAAAGAIEYGAFYKGQLFFFASLKNRQRFQNNPDWFAAGTSAPNIENSDQFPFLRASSLE